MKQEGIFRLSAQASLVDDLRRAYDSGNAVDLSQVESNVCCGLLKLFLREMSEPLFPFRLYKAFVSFHEGKNNYLSPPLSKRKYYLEKLTILSS